jgi:hypothetical protein
MTVCLAALSNFLNLTIAYAKLHAPRDTRHIYNMAVELTYLLSPKFYFKRDGSIALGSIVVDPFRLHLVLTAVDDSTIAERYLKVETFMDFDQNLTSS